jgi:hypothetical protein
MSFVNRTALEEYIDANIIPNGNGEISGEKQNTALKGVLQFVYDERILTVTLDADGTIISNGDLVGAVNVKVYSGVRLNDNSRLGTPDPGGYTFSAANGQITFASTRVKGETFVIDYAKNQ